MALVKAGRQASLLALLPDLADKVVQPIDLSVRFARFAEPDSPLHLRTTRPSATQVASTDAAVDVEFTQQGHLIASAAYTFSDVLAKSHLMYGR